MKNHWQKPELEVLNVTMTMAGPGIKTPDAVQPDPDAEDGKDLVHSS